MAQAVIIQLRITGPETFEVFNVPVGASTIGRQEGNAIWLKDRTNLVSRQHARLDCTATDCTITDLGSSNGTLVNGTRLTPQVPVPLTHNAVIEIGPFRLLYEAIPVEPPPMAVVVERPVEVEKEKEEEVIPPTTAEPPSVPPIFTLPPSAFRPPPDYGALPPGLTRFSHRLLNYLPGIYHTDFMARFLALFEAILFPIEWNVDNFDLYLNPRTAPGSFLPWLANWYSLVFDSTWNEAQRRQLLEEAHWIYARRGTKKALGRLLEIYTGRPPEILDLESDQPAFTFTIKLGVNEKDVDKGLVERMVDVSKPAHTSYRLVFNK
ncbi:MAG: phage tail protein I [Chloroflexota bacterium]